MVNRMNRLDLLLRLRRAIVRRRSQQLFAWPLEKSPTESTSPGIEVRHLSEDDIHQLIAFRTSEAISSLLQVAATATMYGLFCSDRPVAHGATSAARSRSILVNGYFPLPKGDTLLHTFHVDPKLRGKGLYRNMLSQIADRERAQATSGTIWIDTSISNVASRKGIVAAGFEEVGELEAIIICRKLVFVSIRLDARPRLRRWRVWLIR